MTLLFGQFLLVEFRVRINCDLDLLAQLCQLFFVPVLLDLDFAVELLDGLRRSFKLPFRIFQNLAGILCIFGVYLVSQYSALFVLRVSILENIVFLLQLVDLQLGVVGHQRQLFLIHPNLLPQLYKKITLLFELFGIRRILDRQILFLELVFHHVHINLQLLFIFINFVNFILFLRQVFQKLLTLFDEIVLNFMSLILVIQRIRQLILLISQIFVLVLNFLPQCPRLIFQEGEIFL